MPRALPCLPVAFSLALVAGASFAQILPLSSPTVGASSRSVSSPASYSVDLEGDLKLGGFVFKDGAPFLHNDGGPSGGNTAVGLNALVSATPGVPYPKSGRYNTATGAYALSSNSQGYGNTATGTTALALNGASLNTADGLASLAANVQGCCNTASGAYALQHNVNGSGNAAIGAEALRSNTSGMSNTAIGYRSLRSNTTGSWNTANGTSVLLSNTVGKSNTAIGSFALGLNTSGDRNTALGYLAGGYSTTGSDNIWIGWKGNYYLPTESNTLRVGEGTGTGQFQLTRAFISGIRNAAGSSFTQAVCVSTADQLGPCSPSSTRFKEDVVELTGESDALFALRPVRFRYKEDVAGAEDYRSIQYGLIAEEVAEVFPQLVTYDGEGRPTTVRYEALTPLLLNELKKQKAEIERLRALESEVHELRADLARLDQRTKPAREQAATVARR